jgi:hypothetical protein
MEVKVIGIGRGKNPMWLCEYNLILLDWTKDILYMISPVGLPGRELKKDHCILLGYEYHIDRVIDVEKKPKSFAKELIREAYDIENWYKIFIDDELMYKTLSISRCNLMRNRYLKERRHGDIKFEHLLVVDPSGLRTDFIFPRS